VRRPVVIKVGGSLLGWKEFPARLTRYLEPLRSERLVLVVGGGRAADFVRALDSEHGIGEKRSHGLALRALDLTAEVLAALVPGLAVVERTDDLTRVRERGLIPVLAPRWFVENVDRVSREPLAESWAVSTDSIAARLAVSRGAVELRLVKSAAPLGLLNRRQAADAGFVDPAFPAVSAAIGRVSVVNLRDDPPTTHRLD
jgi:aspartokinase-like uncharacterized kinase